MKKKFIYSLAFFHLFLMTMSVFHVTDKLLLTERTAMPLKFLCSLNFSSWRYGFFSPDVGKSIDISVGLQKTDGSLEQSSTYDDFNFYTANQETMNRFYNLKTKTAADTAFQDLTIRSACTFIFNEEPDIAAVNFEMQSTRFPDMADYRKGVTPDTARFYQIAFSLY